MVARILPGRQIQKPWTMATSATIAVPTGRTGFPKGQKAVPKGREGVPALAARRALQA
jgi:hypothetical protein